MSTDYVLFIHGVKTRNQQEFQALATKLFERIKTSINAPTLTLKPIILFWGDVGIEAQQELLQGFRNSPTWDKFWFNKFRSEGVLEFVGDGALYLSRHVGAKAVRKLESQGLLGLKDMADGDRLHLVTHSWGTVILFDILFATRWEDPSLDTSEPGIRQSVERIRNTLFGIRDALLEGEKDAQTGITLASVSTMGSPLALFNLINQNGASSHDVTPKLKELLEALSVRRQRPLPWRNFAHPGDPVAYPLEGVMPLLLDPNYKKDNTPSQQLVEIQDVLVPSNTWKERLLTPVRQQILPLLFGGEAHGSYWENPVVAQTVAGVIQKASPELAEMP